MPNLGVYLQVPFCTAKCTFCNFHTRIARAGEVDRYGQVLSQEIAELPSLLDGVEINPEFLSLPVDTVYAGGGNPALLSADRWAKIAGQIWRVFQRTDELEFTFEVAPGAVGKEYFTGLHALGVNRLSIGAQSFAPRELRAVGRRHTAEATAELIRTAREAGFCNLSLDLVAGLPYQTLESWRASLSVAVRFRPEHLSVYLLEVDEKSRLGCEALRGGARYHTRALPGEDFLVEAYTVARRYLADCGYCQYEISNFALPGYESRHNRKYWRLDPYVGVGAGAHSSNGRERWANEREPEIYGQCVASGESAIRERRILTTTEQIEEFFFLGLRERQGVDLQAARTRWGTEPVARYEAVVSRLCSEGWLEGAGDTVRLSDRALLVSNEIFQEFLLPPAPVVPSDSCRGMFS